ncbi:cupin domain-containing protein [Actinacidiphila sp. bgisy167]|uniref:cupin domain-containing protein n=1 Tax=Actinacidiphila sp. bgisy167 TaxID=3413797 RepID=UPI003D715895
MTGAEGVLHLRPEGGRTIWFGDAVYSFKATKESTGGRLTLAEASVPPGSGPPPHLHRELDEAFYILSGRFEFLSGDSTFEAGPGDFVYIPHGVRHRFRNAGTHPGRLIFLFTPGGMDEYFTEIGETARAGVAPAPLTPEQIRLIGDLAPRHGLVLHPPAQPDAHGSTSPEDAP